MSEIDNIFLELAEKSEELVKHHRKMLEWKDSPMFSYFGLAIAQMGSLGKKIGIEYLNRRGIETSAKEEEGNDLKILHRGRGYPIEVKFATIGVNGKVTINQIRPKQQFSHLLLITKSIDSDRVYLIPKDIILGESKGQHGGSGATETKIGSFQYSNPPPVIVRYEITNNNDIVSILEEQ